MLRHFSCLVLSLCLFVSTLHAAPRLVAQYNMEPDPRDPKLMADSGPAQAMGWIESGVSFVDGHEGKALHFDGSKDALAVILEPGILDKLVGPYSVSVWVRVKEFPGEKWAAIFCKRTGNVPQPIALGIGSNKGVVSSGYDGKDWSSNIWTGGKLTQNNWHHIAVTLDPGAERIVYVDGNKIASKPAPNAMQPNNSRIVLGKDPTNKSHFHGDLDQLRFFEGVLTPDQVAKEMTGELVVEPVEVAEVSTEVKVDEQLKPAPLVLKLDMDVSTADLFETSPQFIQDSERGNVLVFGPDAITQKLKASRVLDRVGESFTITLWANVEKLPENKWAAFLSKRSKGGATPFNVGVTDRGNITSNGFDGKDWQTNMTSRQRIKPGQWVHIAVTYKTGEKHRLYINCLPDVSKNASLPRNCNEDRLYLGYDPDPKIKYQGKLDNIRFYAKALSPSELLADMQDRLPTHQVQAKDLPEPLMPVGLGMMRYDIPQGSKTNGGFCYQLVEARPGPDALDYIRMTLSGKPVMQDKSKEVVMLRKRDGEEARKLFMQPKDEILQPGNLWFRPLQWRWGRQFVYSGERYLRGSHMELGIITFPVLIKSHNGKPIEQVTVLYDGKTYYDRKEQLNSLILCMPPSESDKAYTITINGRVSTRIQPGFEPVMPGDPQDIVKDFDITVKDGNASFIISNLKKPEIFPSSEQWAEDIKAMSDPKLESLPQPQLRDALQDRLGIDVPVSPMQTYAVSLVAGMSGGFKLGGGHGHYQPDDQSLDEYAALIKSMNFDLIYEKWSRNPNVGDQPGRMDQMAAAMANVGVKFGIVPSEGWWRPSLNHPSIAIMSWNLPDMHRPLYRDVQLQAQRLLTYGNFEGINIGADNAGFVSYWHWAPPNPDRPFAEALSNLWQEDTVKMLNPPNYTGEIFADDAPTDNAAQFLKYVDKLSQCFQSYSYFDRAVEEIQPRLYATTGSYGTNPGTIARGGWPNSALPGQIMHQNMRVMQTYDWNEQRANKPLHNVTEIDALRSYFPDKPCRAILDDFAVHMDLPLRQRKIATALTRGIVGVGTNFIPGDGGTKPYPQIVSEIRHVNDWAHRFGGMYAMTNPQSTIGIVFVFDQAVMRPVVGSKEPTLEELMLGSHEGKVNEAMVMCHAAGFSSRIVTDAEIRRGIRGDVKALLLVGLNKVDDTWHWYDGISAQLQSFVSRGGLILRDFESVCPVQSVETQIHSYAYIRQDNVDQTPMLIERNRSNIEKLRQAMQGMDRGSAYSDDPNTWVIPSQAGDVSYITVLNQAMQPIGESDPMRKAPLTMVAGRPISGQENVVNRLTVAPRKTQINVQHQSVLYDLRQSKAVDVISSLPVDFSTDAFQVYAMLDKPVTLPNASYQWSEDGWMTVTVGLTQQNITGVPVSVTLQQGAEKHTLYGATGKSIKLPLKVSDALGVWQVKVTELLSGQSIISQASQLKIPSMPIKLNNENESTGIGQFVKRVDVPVVIALTASQIDDPAIKGLAERLQQWLASKGRKATIQKAQPGDVILSLQPWVNAMQYPRWKTINADMVLLGSPRENMLLFDQWRGRLWHGDTDMSDTVVTYSPFVGERLALNILGPDVKALTQQVKTLTGR